MFKIDKRFAKTLGILLCFILAAVGCRFMPDILQLQRRAYIIFFGLLRSVIYIGIFLSWGFSVKRRIVAPKPRQCLIMVAVLLVFWVYIRTVKYFFVEEADIRRILWYLYYFSMLFIPFLAVCVSELLGKPEYYGLSRWLIVPLLITAGLFLFVLTNDLHQLVFQFPPEALEHTDADFSYGPGYYPVFFWEILCAVYAVAVMILKCRIPGERRVRLLPFVPLVISVLYAVAFINRIPLLSALTRDVTIFQCLFFMLCFECCIRCSLIQSNTDYYQFFNQSSLPMIITDRDYHVHLQSDSVTVPEYEIMRRTEQGAVMLSKQYRLRQCEIAGGRVLWKEDTARIAQAMDKLKELNESLEENYQMKAEAVRTQREKERLRETNRIYDRMQKQTEKQLLMMQELLLQLEQNEDPKRERAIVWKLAVLGAYIKRRNNLLFLSETEQMIQSRELDYCFHESIQALKLNGIHSVYRFQIEEPLAFSDMVKLYDAFECVIEQVMDDLERLDIVIYGLQDQLRLMITLLLKRDIALSLSSEFEIEKESACVYELYFEVGRGEDYGIL